MQHYGIWVNIFTNPLLLYNNDNITSHDKAVCIRYGNVYPFSFPELSLLVVVSLVVRCVVAVHKHKLYSTVWCVMILPEQ